MSAGRDRARLRSLSVEGFGLIERTSVELGAGLNAFTGETGSGKSMVIDALGFAFGARTGADVIRAGADKASVFAELEPDAALDQWLDTNGYTRDSGEPLIVSREMVVGGRSSARINGKPATAGQLRELGDMLLDVVGQHEHARLAQPPRHAALLDEFAGSGAIAQRRMVGVLHSEVRELRERLEALRASDASALRSLEDARFAADEISAARLRSGEIEELRERRSVLANAAKITEALQSASDALDASDRGATAALGRAYRSLDGVARHWAPLRELSEQARALQSGAQELAGAVASLGDDAAGDSVQLEAVEDRLAVVERLQKKYGATVEEINAAGERHEADAAALEHRDEAIEKTARELQAREADLEAAALALSDVRRRAATELSDRVGKELQSLGMRGARFRCGVDPAGGGIGPTGADRIEFYAALNENEPERPIAKAASGGELSRLLLALKVVLAQVDPTAVVVLDEIDAGIGGAAARNVGARIASLARSVQVLCVTHLAQIAAFADEHVALEKRNVKGRAVIEARVLKRPERTAEIARMLSGDSAASEALVHAEALLREIKTGSAR